MLALALAKPLKLFYATNQRDNAFPVIANFDDPIAAAFITENHRPITKQSKIEFVATSSLGILKKSGANHKALKVTSPSVQPGQAG